ncbi:MAG: TlpA disulfide reductase family protein [Candidatus Omnitrophota bacterium]|nr:TlpA disulfide reductase family protein [Candidatus Omnitrophota bacterium]
MRTFLVLLAGLTFLVTPLPAHAQEALQAPDFSQIDLAGNSHTLGKYHGRPLILYFWASWCPACMRDLEAIKKVYPDVKAQGVGFLSVSLDSNRKRLEAFVGKRNIPYPVLHDGKKWDSEMVELFKVQGTPTFVIIDGYGKIIHQGSWAEQIWEMLPNL